MFIQDVVGVLNKFLDMLITGCFNATLGNICGHTKAALNSRLSVCVAEDIFDIIDIRSITGDQ